MTFHEAVADARTRLRNAGLDDLHARLDSEVLARHVLGWDRAAWLTGSHAAATGDFLQTYESLVARRVDREPVAYIVGHREFCGRDFVVTPAVLIPRPETELIVEFVLRHAPAGLFQRVVDVGTGSGAIAVTLAIERPDWHVEAVDLSRGALEIAQRNAHAYDVASRITFLHGNLLEPTMGLFDVIVSNPPYVAMRDAAGLSRDVRDHEPHLALFGGEDGLDVPRRLLSEAAARLAPGGWIAMEFGYGQQDDVERAAMDAGLQPEHVLSDLQGIARTLVARR